MTNILNVCKVFCLFSFKNKTISLHGFPQLICYMGLLKVLVLCGLSRELNPWPQTERQDATIPLFFLTKCLRACNNRTKMGFGKQKCWAAIDWSHARLTGRTNNPCMQSWGCPETGLGTTVHIFTQYLMERG